MTKKTKSKTKSTKKYGNPLKQKSFEQAKVITRTPKDPLSSMLMHYATVVKI